MEDVIDRLGASSSSSLTVIHSETTLPEDSAPSNKRKQGTQTSAGGGKCYRMVLHCRKPLRLGSSSDSSDEGVHFEPDLSEQDQNPVETAIGNAYNALDEAKDFAEEALKVAESAYTAARDTAASARALLGALVLVQEAVESVQEAFDLNAKDSGEANAD